MLYLTQRVETPAQATASVTLPIDVRVKSRIKVTLNDGRQAGLLLPRGLLLRGGDILSNENGSEFIEVIAADEAVSVVRCEDPFMLAKACYHLGNRHVPAADYARRAALPSRPRPGRYAAPVWPGRGFRASAV
ncbi:Urease accessory protein UreE [Klebsiella oxytoca]|nr:Urease accessory protein UreE [Klebsiella oxytoca]